MVRNISYLRQIMAFPAGFDIASCLGTHPELLHTLEELKKRKERRVTLADLKRKREAELATSIRTHEEDSIWTWWMVCRLFFSVSECS
jgi:hypothetical protein